MKKFEMKKVGILLRLDLRNNRKQIVGWSIAIFSILFLYMILFPSVKEMGQSAIDGMPKEMLQLMGMDGSNDWSNFVSYFGTIYNLVLIAVSIFAATFCGGLLHKEEKNKSIEFLYSMEVSRMEIYSSKIITGLLGLSTVIICGTIATIICGYSNGGITFILVDVLNMTLISSFIPFFFGGLAYFLGGVTGKIGVGSFTSMCVLASYLLGYLGNLLGENGSWLKYLSPFEMLSPQKVVPMKSGTIGVLIIYVIIMMLLLIFGGLIYRKRDFVI